MNRFETLGSIFLASAFCLSFTACDSSESTASTPTVTKLDAAPTAAPIPEEVDQPLDAELVLESEPAPATSLPEEAVLASTAMTPPPVEIGERDKTPITSAGETNIHLDELELGSGWASSRCEQPTRQFMVDQDERINLCFRVVHQRVAESVTVEWARDGKLRHSIEVNIPSTRAYLTRAWMPVTAGRAGQWTATVKSADGVVLGQLDFTVAK
jgi:hypothetical protein